jgi:hypothetical protein
MNAMLGLAANAGEMGVSDVEVRIDAKGYGEEITAILLIAIEEIAVVKVPVRAGIGNRLWRLVNGIVIALG